MPETLPPPSIRETYTHLPLNTGLILPIAKTILLERTKQNYIEYEFNDGTYVHVTHSKTDPDITDSLVIFDIDGYDIYAGPPELQKPPVNFEALRQWRRENLPPPPQTEEELQERVNKLLNSL